MELYDNELKFRFKYHPNPEWCTVHIPEPFLTGEITPEAAQTLFGDLERVQGIQEAHLTNFKGSPHLNIRKEKGALWHILVKQLETVLTFSLVILHDDRVPATIM